MAELGITAPPARVFTSKVLSTNYAEFQIARMQSLIKQALEGDCNVRPIELMKRISIRFSHRREIGGKNALVIVDDGGGYQVVWADQQLPFVGAP